MKFILVSDGDKMSREQNSSLVEKLINSVFRQQHLTSLQHEVGVEDLLLLVLVQRVQGVLGPPQLAELKLGLVDVRGELHHLLVTILCLLLRTAWCLNPGTFHDLLGEVMSLETDSSGTRSSVKAATCCSGLRLEISLC